MSDDDFYVAELFSHLLTDVTTIAMVRDAVSLLSHTDSGVNSDRLSAVVGDRLTDDQCENAVLALENTGIVDRDTGTLNRTRLERVTRCAEVLSERTPPPENELVATIPEGETSIDERHFGPLLLRLRELVEGAEDDIFLITPFFSEKIADRLVNPLNAAARRGVDITVTTRYLTYGQKDYNRDFVRALYEYDEIRDRTRLYEYVRDVDDRGGTVHAKMLVTDETACYLGTANLTHRGLRDNLELGVIFRDNSVVKFRDLADSLRRSSLMHRVEYVDGNFAPAHRRN
jgi:phosphatidylserine/phosphatidylglycerophosphate/cardiolipin synthase-like enzyme